MRTRRRLIDEPSQAQRSLRWDASISGLGLYCAARNTGSSLPMLCACVRPYSGLFPFLDTHARNTLQLLIWSNGGGFAFSKGDWLSPFSLFLFSWENGRRRSGSAPTEVRWLKPEKKMGATLQFRAVRMLGPYTEQFITSQEMMSASCFASSSMLNRSLLFFFLLLFVTIW